MRMSDELVEYAKCNLARLYERKKFTIDTKDVKKELCKACKETIDDVYTFATGLSPKYAYGAEWLFDVTGLLYDKDNYISRTVLVAESEWGPELEILNDFEKLLLARADVRVMVFDGTKSPGYQEIFEKFETRINRCEQSEQGDIWFFAALMPNGWKFCRIDTFQSRRDFE